MSWIQRLTGDENPITFTSPETQTVFTPKWRALSVSNNKKIGNFSYPGFRGAQTQDLSTEARTFPREIWFTGPDHDIESRNFLTILDTEVGAWTVDDPWLGVLSLQLVSYSGKIDLMDNGHASVITTSWVESQPAQSNVSPVQSAENVISQTDTLNNSLSEQFQTEILTGEKVSLDPQLSRKSAALLDSVKTACKRVNTIVNNTLGPIIQTAGDLYNTFTSIQGELLNTLDQAEFEAAQVAGQISQLVQLPGQVASSVETKLQRYASLIDSITIILPEDSSAESVNESLSYELTFGAVIAGACRTVIDGDYTSRSEALQAAGKVVDLFLSVTTALEQVQDLYDNSSVTVQYRSQTQSYSDLRQLVAYAVQYLRDTAETLKIEKTIRVSTEKTPVTLAAKYYPDLSIDDGVDLILNANRLKGNDRLVLDHGRELVVYV